jgi:all-trans-8'-apo-beta-carotenal 15,15'-oxygenase
VQSEGLVKERRAARQLYGGYGTTVPGLKRFPPLPPTSKLKNPANTSILVWGERVFGLYEGDLPTEIAPSDLATLGEKDLGMVVESFSAHPHAVPVAARDVQLRPSLRQEDGARYLRAR